ncbi:MAG TPA: hypothetical protein VHT75_04160 [Acidimicrobiales bacterium]|jgi:hypothetical protein|nr:hypothetical protein [Acidimicrobiales bacterium]
MPKPDHNPDRQIRPFGDFLAEVNGGLTHHELSEQFNELILAVSATGKVGTLTLTLKVAPEDDADGMVRITDNVTVKIPEGKRPNTLWYVTEDGNLSRHNPAQTRLPLRGVPGSEAVIPENDRKENEA